jgi:hypothetical protein
MASIKLDSTKRTVVRLTLVTGSTLATIIGAQSLAALGSPTSSTANAALPADSGFQSQAPNVQQPFSGFSDDGGMTLEQIGPGLYVLRPSDGEGQLLPGTGNGQSLQPSSPNSNQGSFRPRIRTRSSR